MTFDTHLSMTTHKMVEHWFSEIKFQCYVLPNTFGVAVNPLSPKFKIPAEPINAEIKWRTTFNVICVVSSKSLQHIKFYPNMSVAL